MARNAIGGVDVHPLDFDLGLHRLAEAAVPETSLAPTLWHADRFWSAAARAADSLSSTAAGVDLFSEAVALAAS